MDEAKKDIGTEDISRKISVSQSRLGSLWFAPAVLLAVFICVCVIVFWLVNKNIYNAKQKQLVGYAEFTEESIRLQLNGNKDYLLMIAKDRAEGLMDAKLFQERASRYVADHPEIICINWVDADFFITDVAPIAPNKQIVGLKLELPEPKRVSHLAMETRQPVYTRPFEVVQGEIAFELWVPVYHDDVFLGLLGGIYSFKNFLYSIIPPHALKENSISVVDASGKVLLALPSSGTVDENLVHRVHLNTSTENGAFIQFKGYGQGRVERGLLLIEFLCLAFAIGMAYAMWRMKREMDTTKNSGEFIDKLISSANAMIICLDLDGNVTVFNETAEKITGYSRGEIIGRNWFELVAPRDRFPEVWKIFEEFKKRGKSVVGEFQNPILTKNGEERIIEWRNSDLHDKGNVIGTISYGIDITESKQAEEERKSHLCFTENLDRINKAIQGTNELESMMRDVLNIVLSVFDCDRAWLFYPCDPNVPSFRVPMEVNKPEYPGANLRNIDVPMSPDVAQNLREAMESDVPVTYIAGTGRPINKVSAEQFGVQSQIFMTIYPKLDKPWVLGMHQCSYARVWTDNEKRLFKEIGRRIADSLNTLLLYRDLQESERKYRRLVETSSEGIWMIDNERKTTFVNTRIMKMLGYAENEMMGRKFDDFVTPEELADHEEQMAKRREGESGLYERRFLCKNGDILWCHVSATPIFDDEKRFIGSFGMITDISKRKKAEEALIVSESDLKDAQRVAKVGSWDWDAKADTIKWSDEYYRIYGFDPAVPPPGYEEHLKAYTKESAARLDAAVKRNIENGEPYEVDLELVDPKSECRWITARSETKRDRKGNIIGLRGTAQDITERKKTEEEIRNNEERSKSLLKLYQLRDVSEKELASYALEEGVRLTGSKVGYLHFYSEGDVDLQLFMWSKEALKMCTASKEHHYPLANAGVWADSIRTRKPVIHNDYQNLPDKKGYPLGHFPINSHMSVPIIDNDRIVAVAGVGNKDAPYGETDVLQLTLFMSGIWSMVKQKRDEDEKNKLWNQLLQSQKLESVGRLTGGIAHDFNNILTGILGYGQLAIMKIDKDDPLVRILKIIVDSTEKASKLIKQLLAFSRKQVLDMRLNNLNKIVENMSTMLARVIGEHIKLDIDTVNVVSNVIVDETQIEQVIMNLAVNARDAMPKGGSLRIKTANVYLDYEYCKTHPEVKTGAYVMLSVEDTGVGMSKEVQEKIFEPFFTTKEKGEGTGLGLATVFGIVKQHNGSVALYSEPGKGTVFKVYIPSFKGTVKELTEVAGDELPVGNERILIVDDDDVIRSMAKELLEKLGYSIKEARSGEEALKISEKPEGTIDLMLTDVVMTGMNGWELAKEMLIRIPLMKVIFSSGYMDNPVVLQNIIEHGMPFINKPFSPQILATMVREVLDGK